jgi:GGDEF domain-containing protein
LGIHAASSEAAMLVDRIASLLTSTEIQGYNLQLADFLRPQRKETSDFNAAPQKSVDRSIDNDNAAGLRGGGSAVQHLKRVMDCGVSGYVVLFRLGCLDMICERFGLDAVHDSLMAVAAFLTHSLRSDDAVYHWSDATLLAILQTPASEKVISAAMRRVVDNNRDTTIQIGGRNVMLRIPMEFDITPISQLDQPEDLYKFSIQDEAHW